MTKRRNHSSAFKAKVALAALSGEKTIAALSSEFGVHQTQIHKLVKQLKESAAGIVDGEIKTEEAKKEKELTHLHAKIGQLIVERDFLAEAREWKRLSQAKHGQGGSCNAQHCVPVSFTRYRPFRPVL